MYLEWHGEPEFDVFQTTTMIISIRQRDHFDVRLHIGFGGSSVLTRQLFVDGVLPMFGIGV